MNDHIKTINNKISRTIGLICKYSVNLPNDIKLTFYVSLIRPHCDYCNILSLKLTLLLHKQMVTQRKAIHIVCKLKLNMNTDSIMKEYPIIYKEIKCSSNRLTYLKRCA